MKTWTRALAAFGAAIAVAHAHAQSINVEFDAPSGVWSGAPAGTFAGASGVAGTWNNLPSGAAGTYNLIAVDGSTLATLTRAYSGTPSAPYGFNNTNTSGNHQVLLDDGESINAAVGTVTYTFRGLIPGQYEVITYAIAPDNATFRTSVTVGITTRVVGGVMPANAFSNNITHATHTAFLGNEEPLVIQAALSSGAGTVNGIQIRLVDQYRFYVRASAPVGGDGLSWATAFRDIESALDAGEAFGIPYREAWVAAGTYRPSERTIAADPRSAVFRLRQYVNLYGGFAGTETRRSQRGNPFANPTILTGDIGVVGVVSDNAYNVVLFPPLGGGGNTEVRVDGFTIRDANNTLNSCTAGCVQNWGGGIADLSDNDFLELVNCVVRDNISGAGGGSGSASFGGGLFSTSTPTIQNCTFFNNRARFGAGMYIDSTTALAANIINVAFVGNIAHLSGGGLSTHSNVVVSNALFTGNAANDASTIQGGAAINVGGSISLFNCTFTGNGGDPDSDVLFVNPFITPTLPTITMVNSIVWGNRTPFVSTSGPISVRHSNIQGGYPGLGNLNADPLFIDADGVDNVPGTFDDLAFIRWNSPCIDRADRAFLRPDSGDLDNDGDTSERLSLDLAGRVRERDDPGRPNPLSPSVLDMGCYEFQGVSCAADFDDGSGTGLPDGGVTVDDLLYYFELFSNGDPRADVDDGSGTGTPDGGVTVDDLLYLLFRYDAGC